MTAEVPFPIKSTRYNRCRKVNETSMVIKVRISLWLLVAGEKNRPQTLCHPKDRFLCRDSTVTNDPIFLRILRLKLEHPNPMESEHFPD